MTPIPTPADERREAIAVLRRKLEHVHPHWAAENPMLLLKITYRQLEALVKADAILASEPAREEAPSLLWCCHIRGPDDVIPAPDYATALKLADAVNAVETDPDRPLRAVPALWPWSAESHAGGPTAAPPSPGDPHAG